MFSPHYFVSSHTSLHIWSVLIFIVSAICSQSWVLLFLLFTLCENAWLHCPVTFHSAFLYNKAIFPFVPCTCHNLLISKLLEVNRLYLFTLSWQKLIYIILLFSNVSCWFQNSVQKIVEYIILFFLILLRFSGKKNNEISFIESWSSTLFHFTDLFFHLSFSKSSMKTFFFLTTHDKILQNRQNKKNTHTTFKKSYLYFFFSCVQNPNVYLEEMSVLIHIFKKKIINLDILPLHLRLPFPPPPTPSICLVKTV